MPIRRAIPRLLLISADDAFVERVQRGVGDIGQFMVVASWEPDGLRILSAAERERGFSIGPGNEACGRTVVAIDCRQGSPHTASEQVASIRAATGEASFVVGIGTLASPRARRTVSIAAGIADAIILADHEDIGVVLRAFANDRSATGAYAEAYSLLMVQRDHDRGVLSDVLGSGCAISSVKQLAAHRCCDRGTPRRQCRRRGSRPPGDTIELAQAVCAVLLVTSGRQTARAAATFVGLTKPDSLTMLVERVLHRPLGWFRDESTRRAPPEILRELLSARGSE